MRRMGFLVMTSLLPLIAWGQTGVTIRSDMPSSTDQMHGSTRLRAGVPYYDVTAFGAKCDSSADDTVAFQSAIKAWSATLATGGILYVPPSGGRCVIQGTLTFPNNSSWGYILLDNNLNLTHALALGNLTALIGRSGALGTAFSYGPGSTIAMAAGANDSVVELSGKNAIWLENLDLRQNSTSNKDVISIHDNSGAGTAFITLKNVRAGSFNTTKAIPLHVFPSGSTVVAGFGLFMEHCTFVAPSSTVPSISVTNFGQMFLSESFVNNGGVSLTNAGIPSMYMFRFDKLLSEALNNTDLFMFNSTAGTIDDIRIDQTDVSDAAGSVYLLKDTGGHTSGVTIGSSSATGNGYVDPRSAAISGLRIFVGLNNGSSPPLPPGYGGLYEFFSKAPPVVFGGNLASTNFDVAGRMGVNVANDPNRPGASSAACGPLHAGDSAGVTGIPCAALPGNPVVVVDSKRDETDLDILSANGKSGTLYFCRPKGLCRGWLSYDHSRDTMSLITDSANGLIADSTKVSVLDSQLWLRGSGGSGKETVFASHNTAQRTITFPDVTGIVCLTSTCKQQHVEVGTVTLNNAVSVSHPFNAPYSANPVCQWTPQGSDPGSQRWWNTSTTSSAQVTFSSPVSATMGFTCFGDMN